jgi:hypothetical protein
VVKFAAHEEHEDFLPRRGIRETKKGPGRLGVSGAEHMGDFVAFE